MITFIRSATIQQGVKAEVAVEWAVKVAVQLNDSCGTNVRVNRTIGGKLLQVHWIATYDSLAHLEEMGPKIDADEGYQALLKEADREYPDGLFMNESMTDHIFDSVP